MAVVRAMHGAQSAVTRLAGGLVAAPSSLFRRLHEDDSSMDYSDPDQVETPVGAIALDAAGDYAVSAQLRDRISKEVAADLRRDWPSATPSALEGAREAVLEFRLDVIATGRMDYAEAERLGATPFHEQGAELARRGDVSSFEVVMERYELGSDPAMALLGRIVNTADIKQSRYAQPEGAGLRAITDGLLLIYDDDHALNAAGARVYDALYAYCQDQVRRGRAGAAS